MRLSAQVLRRQARDIQRGDERDFTHPVVQSGCWPDVVVTRLRPGWYGLARLVYTAPYSWVRDRTHTSEGVTIRRRRRRLSLVRVATCPPVAIIASLPSIASATAVLLLLLLLLLLSILTLLPNTEILSQTRTKLLYAHIITTLIALRSYTPNQNNPLRV